MKRASTYLKSILLMAVMTFSFTGCINPIRITINDNTTETEDKSAKSISISASKTELSDGEKITLTAVLTPADTTDSVKWQIISGANNATLSSTTGKSVSLTAKNSSSSSAAVKVKAVAGSVSNTVSLTVKAKQSQSNPETPDTPDTKTSETVYSGPINLNWSGDTIFIEASKFASANTTTKIQFTYKENSATSEYYKCKLMSGSTELYSGTESGCAIDRTSSNPDNLHAISISSKPSSTSQTFSYVPSAAEWAKIKEDGLYMIGYGMSIVSIEVIYEEPAEPETPETPSGSDEPEDESSLPSTSVAMASAMQIGWNLGNALDAHSDSSKNKVDEDDWGLPKTTKAMIDAVAAKGFKTIRIPVSWHNHIADEETYKINETWMARVKQVVDWAYKDNGMYVILNIHHDNRSPSEFESSTGFCLTTNEAYQTRSKEYISKVWTQIATEFADYNNRLVFEVINEPRDIGGATWGNEWTLQSSEACSIITSYEKAGIDAIRAVKGNENRFLMVPGYAAAADISMLNYYTMPSDSATDRLMLSTHAYSPYVFAMYNGSELHTEFTSSDESSLEYLFNTLHEKYVSKGIGVVMGEASASDKQNDEERLKWIKSYFGKAKEKGIPVVLWDNMVTYTQGGDLSEFHGWLNRNTCQWYFEDLVDEMIKQSKQE